MWQSEVQTGEMLYPGLYGAYPGSGYIVGLCFDRSQMILQVDLNNGTVATTEVIPALQVAQLCSS